ncbi:unnamed protein product [Pleuronectes platessa]|uniref:Uncharacterized protein n=1 Tax=Pleuronectes platessa TaxID=8262 RepID=A0A9N7UUU6_PLEPL|nr:unnamed protein product [Pleuronectes platessa]
MVVTLIIRSCEEDPAACCPACTHTLSPCLPAHPGGEQPSSARYPACLSGYLTAPPSPAGSFIVTPCGPVSSVHEKWCLQRTGFELCRSLAGGTVQSQQQHLKLKTL